MVFLKTNITVKMIAMSMISGVIWICCSRKGKTGRNNKPAKNHSWLSSVTSLKNKLSGLSKIQSILTKHKTKKIRSISTWSESDLFTIHSFVGK